MEASSFALLHRSNHRAVFSLEQDKRRMDNAFQATFVWREFGKANSAAIDDRQTVR